MIKYEMENQTNFFSESVLCSSKIVLHFIAYSTIYEAL